MSETTIFDKILSGEIPTEFVYEDENVVAFKDIAPLAKIHLLFIHRSKSKDIVEMMNNNEKHVSDIFKAITKYVQDNDIDQSGFRVVTNIGAQGGQSVFYTHFHLLAGEQLRSFGA